MVNLFQQVYRSLNNNPTNSIISRHLPMINDVTASYESYLLSVSQIRKKKALMSWFRTMPELTALISKVAKDIVYKYHFEPMVYGDKSRNKILKANKFAQQICLKKVMLSQVVDLLVTGEAFGWIGKIPDEVVKERIGKIINKKCWGMEQKEKDWVSDKMFMELKAEEGLSDLDGIDEDLLRPRKYRYVSSSTIEIIHDLYDIQFYNQVVGVNSVKFKPKEVVHYTLMDIDGKISGFTPVESILVQLELLRQMWQNQLSLHKNGGYPDTVFILKNVKVNDASYKRIEEQLAKYSVVETKHGNMLFTGDVDIKMLEQLDGMQFKDQGLYITGIMAFQWGVPRSSIPFIIGGTNTRDDTGGNSEKGYWRNIEFAQDIFAETMNTQLWIPHFGVKLVFDNTFPAQDVQLQTANQLRLGNIMSENNLWRGIGKQLNKFALFKELGRSDTELEDYDKIAEMEAEAQVAVGVGTNAQGSPKKANTSDDKNNENNQKRVEQDNVIARRGKPIGI